jgi:hypothetical protein
LILNKIVEKVLNCETTDKDEIIKLLSKCIEEDNSECEVCEMLYRKCYGNTLIPELCEEIISKINTDGTSWNLEDTNGVARKLDIDFDTVTYSPEEFRTAMIMEHNNHYVPLKKSGVNLEATGWGRMADYSLTKCPSKLVDCYFC